MCAAHCDHKCFKSFLMNLDFLPCIMALKSVVLLFSLLSHDNFYRITGLSVFFYDIVILNINMAINLLIKFSNN
jgi:hypothetical protein